MNGTSGIRSRGRLFGTIAPNWRLEDTSLDPYQLRVALWLASHADRYRTDHVTRNEIARRTGISGPKVTESLDRLVELKILTIDRMPQARGGGERFVITFDHDVWEQPAGSHAPSAGSHAPGMLEAPLPAAGSHAPSTIVIQLEDQLEEQLSAPQPSDADGELPHYRPALFAECWDAYPIDEGRYDACRAWDEGHVQKWLANVADGKLRDAVMAYAETDYVEDGKVKHFGNWLRDRRFNDRHDKRFESQDAARSRKRKGVSLDEGMRAIREGRLS
jgi:hypothetical protein